MPGTSLLSLPTCILDRVFVESRRVLPARQTCQELRRCMCARSFELCCTGLGNRFRLSGDLASMRRNIIALVNVCRQSIARRQFMGCTLSGPRYEKNLHNIRKYNGWDNHIGQVCPTNPCATLRAPAVLRPTHASERAGHHAVRLRPAGGAVLWQLQVFQVRANPRAMRRQCVDRSASLTTWASVCSDWVDALLQAFQARHEVIMSDNVGSQPNLRHTRKLLLSIGETALPFVQGPLHGIPDNLSQGMEATRRSQLMLHTVRINMGLSVQCDFKSPSQKCSHVGIDPADSTLHLAFMQTLRQHMQNRRMVLSLGDIHVSPEFLQNLIFFCRDIKTLVLPGYHVRDGTSLVDRASSVSGIERLVLPGALPFCCPSLSPCFYGCVHGCLYGVRAFSCPGLQWS